MLIWLLIITLVISLCMYFAVKYSFLFFRNACIIIEPTMFEYLASCSLKENKYIIIDAWLDYICMIRSLACQRACTHVYRHIILQLQKVCTIFFDHNLIYNDYKYWLHMNKFDTLSYFIALTCTVMNIKK